MHYTDYMSMSSMARAKTFFKKSRIESVWFNNLVAREKLRSSNILKELQDKFEKATNQLKAQGGKEKRQMLMQVHKEFEGEAELARYRLEILEESSRQSPLSVVGL